MLFRSSFGLGLGDGNLRVEVLPDTVTYSYAGKEPLEVRHGDTVLTLEPGTPVTQPVQAPAEREAPRQPKGRTPVRRVRDEVRVAARSAS